VSWVELKSFDIQGENATNINMLIEKFNKTYGLLIFEQGVLMESIELVNWFEVTKKIATNIEQLIEINRGNQKELIIHWRWLISTY
jgi:hypothetical protein